MTDTFVKTYKINSIHEKLRREIDYFEASTFVTCPYKTAPKGTKNFWICITLDFSRVLSNPNVDINIFCF